MSIEKRREWTRRLVHLSFGVCVLLVNVLGRWWCAALAAAALVYNALLAPRMGLDRGYRRGCESRLSGLTTYPLAVLLLLLSMPLPVAAGAWAVMAAADPVAAGAGTLLPAPRVPGNPRKSLSGSLAGWLAGTAACYGLLLYMGVQRPLAPAATAAAAGMLAEALPLPVDDNLPIALAAAASLLAWGL